MIRQYLDAAKLSIHGPRPKRSTTGLNVRFLSVTMPTRHGRIGKSTGSTFSELKRATDLGAWEATARR
jgi:hypothetical protein